MNGSQMPALGVYSWPGAEIGFMDPEVGVNVAFGSKLSRIEDENAREAQRLELVRSRRIDKPIRSRRNHENR